MSKREFDKKALGIKIKELRKKSGLTQNKLSEMVGVDSKHISHIENATGSCSLATFIAIANALDINADYLLENSLNSGIHDGKDRKKIINRFYSMSEGQQTLVLKLMQVIMKTEIN